MFEPGKDYYQILGVTPTAEDIVIRAAYKALAQRYHPDKYQGDPADAKRIMQGILEAYSILSNAETRKQYDEWRTQQSSDSDYQPENQDDELSAAMIAYDKDWETACSVFPDLEEHYQRLNKIAHRLSATYKILLLETKKFPDRKVIACLMEDEFFRSYFGDNPEVISFAKSLVMNGQKKAAKSLNNYVRVIGKVLDSRSVIDAICNEHGIQNTRKIKDPDWRKAQREINNNPNEQKANLNQTKREAKANKQPLTVNEKSSSYVRKILFAVIVLILLAWIGHKDFEKYRFDPVNNPESSSPITTGPDSSVQWYLLGTGHLSENNKYSIYSNITNLCAASRAVLVSPAKYYTTAS